MNLHGIARSPQIQRIENHGLLKRLDGSVSESGVPRSRSVAEPHRQIPLARLVMYSQRKMRVTESDPGLISTRWGIVLLEVRML